MHSVPKSSSLISPLRLVYTEICPSLNTHVMEHIREENKDTFAGSNQDIFACSRNILLAGSR
jgi:hypothetical protein